MHSSKISINNFKNIKTINEHSDNVSFILLLSDGRLASCSYDSTIKIFNINNNYHCDITINTGHTERLNSICYTKNNKLVSCSEDKSIKIWKIFKATYQCEYIINDAHTSSINNVISLPNNRLGSCSNDNTIKIWNSNPPYNLIKTLKGHFLWVSSIFYLKENDILLSESLDFTLRFWDLPIYQCNTIIKTKECFFCNSFVELVNNRIVIGGKIIIIIINISKGIIERQIENEKLGFVYSLIQLRDGNILCGLYKGLSCIYDLKENTLYFNRENMHKNDILCLLVIDKQQFISCSEDKTIKIWKY